VQVEAFHPTLENVPRAAVVLNEDQRFAGRPSLRDQFRDPAYHRFAFMRLHRRIRKQPALNVDNE
jgi:hypothetical protein